MGKKVEKAIEEFKAEITRVKKMRAKVAREQGDTDFYDGWISAMEYAIAVLAHGEGDE